MQTNQAMRIHSYGGPETLQRDEIPVPTLANGQVLVQVGAAGVNSLDWKIRDGLVKDAFPLPLPAVLGIELAGTIIAVSPGTMRLRIGDRVFGPLAGLGAYASLVAVDEAKLSLTPTGLTDVQAAAIPVAALTAWQALRAAGELHPGLKILIHGAAGGVGGFAVQFAETAGAIVTATAATTSRDYVLGLGANMVIDRQTERFEDHAKNIDLVLDLVGGETLARSWATLAPNGVIISTAAPDIETNTPPGRRGKWFAMQPDPVKLREIADAIVAGTLRSTIAQIVNLAGLPAALETLKTGHAPGKIVVDFNL